MTLTLSITNRDRLENGSPLELVLHYRGAIIGRAQTCDWSLPDETRVLSSRHCEIKFQAGDYTLVDLSTNGTFLGNESERMAGPRRVQHGDRFRLGPFELEARLSGEARARFEAEAAASAQAAQAPSWSDWDDFPGGAPAAPATAADPFATDASGGWDMPGEARADVSAWADRANGSPGGPSADQIFSSLTDNHKVDWTSAAWDVAPGFDPFAIPGDTEAARRPSTADPFSTPATPSPSAHDPFGGPLNDRERAPAPLDPFGSLDPMPVAPPPPPPPAPSPAIGASPQGAFPPVPAATQGWSPHAGMPASAPGATPTDRTLMPAPPAASPAPPAPVPASAAVAAAAPSAPPDAAYRELITALGIPSASLSETPEAAAARAGRMLRRLLAGLMVLLEARARAKDEMGASATQLRFEGNNPLKFARNVEQALQMMMNPAMQGYMDADQAVEDSYRDLQAHQIATLRAMQGALRATLQRFSPASIKSRLGDQSVLAKLVPGKREAALWRAYEKQFSGVAEGSAEAFLDIFSKEFRQAYEDAARGN